jgi:hypothetical protein
MLPVPVVLTPPPDDDLPQRPGWDDLANPQSRREEPEEHIFDTITRTQFPHLWEELKTFDRAKYLAHMRAKAEHAATFQPVPVLPVVISQ